MAERIEITPIPGGTLTFWDLETGEVVAEGEVLPADRAGDDDTMTLHWHSDGTFELSTHPGPPTDEPGDTTEGSA